MLENVTIIIPAHNRPDRLTRLLKYYESTGAHLLVPDSSTDIYTGTFNDKQVTYRHYPGMHFLLKIREILHLISTPYVLYCADDDFAVPSGIRAVTEFLDANPDYSVAQGHYLTFEPHRDGKVKFFPRYIRNFDNVIDSDNTLNRLQHEKSMYASMLYGVTRSDIFKKIYSYCFNPEGELRFKNLFLAEEFFNHSMLIMGKYATLPVFYSARERITGSATETTVPLSVIKNSPAYKPEFDGFIEALALMLCDTQPGMSIEDARLYIWIVSQLPIDTNGITFKRRVNALLSRHRWLSWAAELSALRYKQKGLKAVAGMPSYPVKTITPEIEQILQALQGHYVCFGKNINE